MNIQAYKKKLSIIIVTYNSEDIIFECLHSIIQNNDIGNELEIIIVDNGSANADKLFEEIKTTFTFDIILVKNSGNNGFGDGNNLGVHHCNSKYFIVMNPDVRILNPVFSYLLSKFEKNEKIGLLGVTFSDKSCPFYFKPEYFNLFHLIFFKVYVSFLQFDMQQMFPSGSFLMFDKETFIKAGCFDNKFFLFYEEPDISNRILTVGKMVLLASEVEVLHLTQGRGQEFNEKLANIEIDSLLHYLSKYGFDKRRVLSKYILVYQLKMIVASVLNNKTKKILFRSWVDLITARKNNL